MHASTHMHTHVYAYAHTQYEDTILKENRHEQNEWFTLTLEYNMHYLVCKMLHSVLGNTVVLNSIKKAILHIKLEKVL